MRATDAVGEYGERLAVRHLESVGFVVLARRWRCARGELDIIAVDDGCLVVCEVKTRRSVNAGEPAEAVTPAKLARLRQLTLSCGSTSRRCPGGRCGSMWWGCWCPAAGAPGSSICERSAEHAGWCSLVHRECPGHAVHSRGPGAGGADRCRGRVIPTTSSGRSEEEADDGALPVDRAGRAGRSCG
jgi:putative endonuclease